MEGMVSVEERLRLQRRQNWKCAVSFIAALPVKLALTGPESLIQAFFLWIVFVALWAVFVWGCIDLARSRGYGWQMGLLGFGWILGYVVLYYMRDRWLIERHRERLGQQPVDAS